MSEAPFPVQVYEDVWDLSVQAVEVVPFLADGPDPSYPFPRLAVTDRVSTPSLRTAVLENGLVRVVICPDLGGRILSFVNLSTGSDVIPRPSVLTPVAGGRRGVSLPVGIEFRYDADERRNAMGPVAVHLELPEEDSDPGGVWVGETAMGDGLGFHALFTLHPGRAEMQVDVHVSNRTLHSVRYEGQWALHLGEGVWSGSTYWASGSALTVTPGETTVLDGIVAEPRIVRVGHLAGPLWLGPRMTDAWSLYLSPLSDWHGIGVANREVALRLDAKAVQVWSAEARPGHKLVLLTESGNALEAPIGISAGQTITIPLEDLPSPPQAVALLDGQSVELLRAPCPVPSAVASVMPVAVGPVQVDPGMAVGDLRRMGLDPALRAASSVALAIRAFSAGDPGSANRELEQALLFNGDDPLTWWAKAMARRLGGDESEEASPELLNAHFLAPLEPVLRAEAFLSQSLALGKDPSPLVRPVAEIPEELVEVGCLLIEHGLLDQANRWLDEALRHHDLAMLRYLMAYVLLEGTRMDMDAAEHVRAASRALVPPMPWRPVEHRVLRRLLDRFPSDVALRRLFDLNVCNIVTVSGEYK